MMTPTDTDILKTLAEITKSTDLEQQLAFLKSLQKKLGTQLPSEQTAPEQAVSEQTVSEQTATGQAVPGHAVSGQAAPEQTTPEQATPKVAESVSPYATELQTIKNIEEEISTSKDTQTNSLLNELKRQEKIYFKVSAVTLVIALIVVGFCGYLSVSTPANAIFAQLSLGMWIVFGLAIFIILSVWIVFTVRYMKTVRLINLLYSENFKIQCTIHNEINKQRFALIKKYVG